MTRPVLIVLVVVSLLTAACTTDDDPQADRPTTTTNPRSDGDGGGTAPPVIEDAIRIEVLSSHPDRVSGNDARIRVTPEPGGSVADLGVTLDGTDVTSQLSEVDGVLEGVVSGFVEGTTTLRARHDSNPGEEAVQRVRAWPLTGPMISGPHTPLAACSTEAHGLGAATDANCSAPTTVTWRYVATDGRVLDLEDPSVVPADVATVTFDDRQGTYEGPFLLRHERGVLNRSIYDIVTVQPGPGSQRSDSPAWSGSVVYRFGDGCGATYGQGRSLALAEDVELLSRGHAVATATFNTGAVQCNDVVSAETVMMVKERLIEEFGVPAATIGEGRGFGAAQAHLITQNYPGVLDAVVAVEPFPDVVTVLSGAADCVLLQRWYSTPAGSALTPAQQGAINGHATNATCRNWHQRFGGVVDPTTGCDPGIDASQIYEPTTNPGGIRCTIFDQAVNVFGPDPDSGAARRPLDNVGVQYGLNALNAGTISFEQFLSLNRDVGGLDGDGRHQPARTEADPDTVATTYETGRVSSGVGDQNMVPLIEVDVWNDPVGEITDFLRPFSLRDRLTRGASPELAPGLRIWSREPTPGGAAATTEAAEAPARLAAIDTAADWLDALATARGSRSEALDESRPDEAGDSCLPPGTTAPIRGVHVWDEDGTCQKRYPVSGSPRTAAGAPRADDVLKCELKAVDPTDYEFDLTNDQYEQLLEVFPTGVCDWMFSGVGQVSPSMPDRTFEDVVTPEQLA